MAAATENRFMPLPVGVPGPDTQVNLDKTKKPKKRKELDRSPPTTAPKKQGKISSVTNSHVDDAPTNLTDPTNDENNVDMTTLSEGNPQESPDGNQQESSEGNWQDIPERNAPDGNPTDKPNPDNKWHIIFHSTKNVPLETSALDQAIQKICPRVEIVSSMRTSSKRSIFYRTGSPIADFNSVYKHRVALCQEVKTMLKIDAWKITAPHSRSVEVEPKHVVVKDVPTDYSIEDLKCRIDQEVMANIHSLGRITNSKTGRPIPIIRIICNTEDVAKTLVNNGLILGNRKLKVEPANPRFNPLRCFHCSRFGHHSQECNNRQCCAICGYEHRTSECPNRNLRREHYCINCHSSSHRARDRTCPIFIEEAGKLRQKEETKTKKLIETAGIQVPPRPSTASQIQSGVSWADIAANKQHVEHTNRNLGDVKKSIEEIERNIADQHTQTTDSIRLEMDSKCKQITEDLRLEIQMNRTGYQSLLETNKSTLESLLSNFAENIEHRVKNIMNETLQAFEAKIGTMLAQQKAEYNEENSKIVYHQTKNALASIGQGQQTQRVQSLHRPASTSSLNTAGESQLPSAVPTYLPVRQNPTPQQVQQKKLKTGKQKADS